MLIGRLCGREDNAGVRCGFPAVEEREVVAFGARARVYLCEACAGGRAPSPASPDPWSDGFAVARAQAKSALDSALRDAMRSGIALDGPAAGLVAAARQALDSVDAEACRAQADPEVMRRANLLDGLSVWLMQTCHVGTWDNDDIVDHARISALRECLDDGAFADDVIRVHHASLDRGRLSLRAWLARFDTEELVRIREAVLARQKREAQAVADAPARSAAYAVQCAEEDARCAAVERAEAVAREEGAKKSLAEAQANASTPTNA